MTTIDRPCFICDEGYNGEIPCPQCNTEAWNAYHEEHKQTVTVVEDRRCRHDRLQANVQVGADYFFGVYCETCRDVVDVIPSFQARAETVEE